MFNPGLNTRLVIDEQEFKFSPHPVVPTLVWGQEGRHAIVYRIEAVNPSLRPLQVSHNGSGFALKVFRPVFRHPGLLESAEALSWAHELPGMRVCDQKVIRRETHPELVGQYEDLDYAMLMPWIEGQTWFDFLQQKQRVSIDQSRALAESLAWILYGLELNHLAHCDLSSGNVIIDPDLNHTHLVDVEDLYSPWLTPPPMVPAGTPGYQHIEVPGTGQWRPSGDRFSGAVLMAEILTWAHPDVREYAYGESYFAPNELQKQSERLEVLVDALGVFDEAIVETFEDAWYSSSLEGCPPLKVWYDLMDILPREPVADWAPIDVREYEVETAVPDNIAVPVIPTAGSKVPAPKPAKKGFLKRLFSQTRQGGKRGCRVLATLFGVIGVLLCYVVGVAVIWSFAVGIF